VSYGRGFDWHSVLVLTVSLCFLAGCGLPAAGPTAAQLETSSSAEGVDFKLVNLDHHVASILLHYPPPSFGARFKSTRYVSSNALRPGDAVAITVYESGGSSLFGPSAPVPIATGAAVSTIPTQVIEADGTVLMPYVGRLKIAGMTPGQVGSMLAEQLKGKTIEPQVIVTAVKDVANVATVSGDVNQPRIVPLTLRGDKLLDVIAQSGGAKFPIFETYVQVVRNKTIGTVLLQRVANSPPENIIIKPNDQIVLVHNPRTFAVLGASQKVSQYTFDTEKVTLAEALARAGGPIDMVGDPTGIFLFRFEPYELAKQVLGVEDLEVAGGRPPFVPVLYRINLTMADGVFVAQALQMRDKDVLLVTNAQATQLQKMMAVVRSFTGVAYDLRRTGGG
jgi:polysaccharide export outer membrane protein